MPGVGRTASMERTGDFASNRHGADRCRTRGVRAWLYLLSMVDARHREGECRIARRRSRLFRFGHDPSEAGRFPHRQRTAGSDIRGDRAHLASLQTGTVAELAFKESDNRSEPPPARAAFAERFSFDQPNPPNSSLQRSSLSASFDDRHIGDILPSSAAISSAPVAPPAAAPRVTAAAVPVPRPAPKRPPNPDSSSPARRPTRPFPSHTRRAAWRRA